MKNNTELNFLINLNELEVKEIKGSKLYFFNNFYLEPNKITDYIFKNKSSYHKDDEKPSLNGIKFFDKRHFIENSNIYIQVYSKLEQLINQKALYENTILTNYFKFKDPNFNLHEDNYWYPHLDPGYTAIIYLNKNIKTFTNLYEPKNVESITKVQSVNEHSKPWVNKHLWNKIFSIEGKFNRLVLFDAKKFYHGMSLNNHNNTIWRLNQVIFFKSKEETNEINRKFFYS